MKQLLDEERYAQADIITIKIPFNLPYQSENNSFERTDGSFQYDGEFYKMVKQKVEHDTLYVLCIKDKREQKLFNFMADIVKMSSDLPISSALKHLNSFTKDYINSLPVIIFSQQGWLASFDYTPHDFPLRTEFYPVPSPPPEFHS
jgi:hypothetical protein